MLFKQTKALVFFSTPHQGSSTATMGVALGQMASVVTLGRARIGNHLKQLKPSSRDLQTLEMYLQLLPPQFEVLNFVEQSPMFKLVTVSREEREEREKKSPSPSPLLLFLA